MELTIAERLKLLEVLPAQESILTLKIVRKLKESLSFSEAELNALGTKYEFICMHRGEVGGEASKCSNSGFFPIAPKCGEHNELMVPTGKFHVDLTPEMQTKVKEIHMGPQAMTIASDALKRASDQKRLTEAHISLYEKFFPPEETEIPEAIVKSMEE